MKLSLEVVAVKRKKYKKSKLSTIFQNEMWDYYVILKFHYNIPSFNKNKFIFWYNNNNKKILSNILKYKDEILKLIN